MGYFLMPFSSCIGWPVKKGQLRGSSRSRGSIVSLPTLSLPHLIIQSRTCQRGSVGLLSSKKKRLWHRIQRLAFGSEAFLVASEGSTNFHNEERTPPSEGFLSRPHDVPQEMYLYRPPQPANQRVLICKKKSVVGYVGKSACKAGLAGALSSTGAGETSTVIQTGPLSDCVNGCTGANEKMLQRILHFGYSRLDCRHCKDSC